MSGSTSLSFAKLQRAPVVLRSLLMGLRIRLHPPDHTGLDPEAEFLFAIDDQGAAGLCVVSEGELVPVPGLGLTEFVRLCAQMPEEDYLRLPAQVAAELERRIGEAVVAGDTERAERLDRALRVARRQGGEPAGG